MSGTATSGSRVVLDASALIRALVELQPDAWEWVERVSRRPVRPAWPAHLYVEVANALVQLARAGRIDPSQAAGAFGTVRRLRARVREPRRMEFAMAVAQERRLSVYDAAYVVLAEALGAPLVTADRQLANATEQAVLLPG